uniref:NAD(P)H-quinone oxidoreductase subunit 5, chloroplastic n=1 Tax=Utricularia amethystina TaxID=192273 RepID=A0A650DPE3_9LAMI|nr:NADH-plastoquinone oxidoreductase subunit 5 [Utricularia amethystina]
METTYQYTWIIPLVQLPVPILIGIGFLLFPTSTKNIRRMCGFTSILLLTIAMILSINLSNRQINSSSIYQYVWSWALDNDFSLEFGYLIDSLTSIMLILITTVGILVLIYSDNYMAHDQGYLRFFVSMSFFSTSMLGLVTSSNFIQIYFFWELVGMSSYLLIGFWFTRPSAANACQKAFVTNRVGDFGLLLGILGFYWITGSFELTDLFEIINNLVYNNHINFEFATLCAVLVFLGAVAKSAQFPLHVWLADAMEGPTPISALIHAATMVAAGIFLVARLFPIFILIPYIMNLISFIGIITVFLGATLALAQKDIKRGLAYSTMSQLGYMMVALGMGSYRSALFHLITHAYSKALLFLGSGSVIHSMETLVGYSPNKSQNMVLMGGLTKHAPITKNAFLLGTLSLCGIPPLACFWSKDEIINDSWLYSPILGIIAWTMAGFTSFYMFRIYLLTFEGHLNVNFKNYSGNQNMSLYSLSLWGKGCPKRIQHFFRLVRMNNHNQSSAFFFKKIYPNDNVIKTNKNSECPFINIKFVHFYNKKTFSYCYYPCESEITMLFPLLILVLFTLFVGFLGIPFNFNNKNKEFYFDILSKWISPSINLLHQTSKDSRNFYEFFQNAISSVSIAYFGIVLAFFFYKPIYSSFKKFDLINFFMKIGWKNIWWEKFLNILYEWAYNRAYIDAFYRSAFISPIRGLSQLIDFFDKQVIDGIPNGIGLSNLFAGEVTKSVGSGRVSSYLFLISLFSCFCLISFIFS